ncbi:MAG: hypothetical protein Kow00120_30940 [Anaerolineae bacterium]
MVNQHPQYPASSKEPEGNMGHIVRFGIGIGLVALGVIAVLFLAQLTLPPIVEIPVAAQDLPAGTVIDRSLFRVEAMRGLDARTRGAVVGKVEFLTQYEGGIVADGEIVYEGFPLSPRQVVFPDAINSAVDRLTLLTASEHVVFPVDVKPGQVGNFIKAGDFVDLVFTVGRVEKNQLEVPAVPTYVPDLHRVGTPQPPLPSAATPAAPPAIVSAVATPTPTPMALDLPLAVIALPDVRVLRVEREQIPNYAAAAPGLGGESSNQPAFLEGDVVRIYVELAPDDAAIAAFLLASGSVVAPSHRAEIGAQPYGLTWTDFKNWFLSRRPDLFSGVQFP